MLPVVPKSTRAGNVNASSLKSYIWFLMEKIQFTRNMKARTNSNIQWVLTLRGYQQLTNNKRLQLIIKHSRDEILDNP